MGISLCHHAAESSQLKVRVWVWSFPHITFSGLLGNAWMHTLYIHTFSVFLRLYIRGLFPSSRTSVSPAVFVLLWVWCLLLLWWSCCFHFLYRRKRWIWSVTFQLFVRCGHARALWLCPLLRLFLRLPDIMEYFLNAATPNGIEIK